MGLNPRSPGSHPGLKAALNHWATRAALGLPTSSEKDPRTHHAGWECGLLSFCFVLPAFQNCASWIPCDSDGQANNRRAACSPGCMCLAPHLEAGWAWGQDRSQGTAQSTKGMARSGQHSVTSLWPDLGGGHARRNAPAGGSRPRSHWPISHPPWTLSCRNSLKPQSCLLQEAL